MIGEEKSFAPFFLATNRSVRSVIIMLLTVSGNYNELCKLIST